MPPSTDVVAQVLYRLQLAYLIKAGESDTKRTNLGINEARVIAAEQEAPGGPDLYLPLRILLLHGKTDMGKSATINSIFDEPKVATNALTPGPDGYPLEYDAYARYYGTPKVKEFYPMVRLPSLPHLLSSLLKPHSSSRSDGLHNDMTELSYDEDESDQLPPFRVLKKSEYEKLMKEQRSAYLDELDYRETVYLKKQWKEGIRRQKKLKMLIHHMQLLMITKKTHPQRPVLDPQGWDHDIGFDGINFEVCQDLEKNITASIAVLSQEKNSIK
ncbi:hypothetical protein GUJ93_ZPchr0009g1258 [Zizania palustris]|uniref:Translocase of chloroplast 159/132 membrane anchor domain-containing protein n=1 Tax=Zizania palustris TaxID=103762 RepID=A0A8J5UZE1_ZIZPA|nr:hypothetical protein GUJ93_ZPchr0009g1258 [Zizania palustris]